jgi:hypothetical protein
MILNATTTLYEATIPAQPANTSVKYKIIAYDNAGNRIVEDNNGQYYIYTVIRATGVEGYVKDEYDRPLNNVSVIALSKITLRKLTETKTDEMGHYFIETPPGEYVLVFSAAGYADGSVSVSLLPGEVKRINYTLEFVAAEFLEDWGGVKFEMALIGDLTWEVCCNATVKVSVTVLDMGGNMEVEFRQLKLYLIDAAFSQTVPINVRLSVGGLAFEREVSLAVLHGFQHLAPGSSEIKEFRLTSEGSYVDNYGDSWPKLSEESVNVKVYAPQTPLSIIVEAPETIHIDEEFNIKVKLKNEGKYQIKDVNLRLERLAAASPLSPLETGVSALNPGEEFTATFRLRAEAADTSQVCVGYTFRTLWDNYVWQPSKALGFIVVSKVPTSISISVEPSKVTTGESIIIGGSITPAMNTTITLIIKASDGTTKMLNTTSSPNGTFGFTMRLDKEGKYSFVASFPGDVKYEASMSNEAYVEAMPALIPPWLCAIITVACIAIIIAVILVLFKRKAAASKT